MVSRVREFGGLRMEKSGLVDQRELEVDVLVELAEMARAER